MRFLAFAGRNRKELTRDPLSLVFGVGLPVALLLMMQMLRAGLKHMPADLFPVESFAPGMAVFALSFLSLFLGNVASQDRSGAFLMRLSASPMTGVEYLLGYLLPVLPLALLQGAAVLGAALLFGLPLSWRLLPALVSLIPAALFFAGLGLLLGTLLSGNQVGGAASVLVQAAALTGGIWFDLSAMGGAFAEICRALPFYHAVELAKVALTGGEWAAHLGAVLLYAAGVLALSAYLFHRKRTMT